MNKSAEGNFFQSPESVEYEYSANKLAKKYNSYFENFFNTGLISKEDIIRVDAQMESEQMDKIAAEKKRLEQSSSQDRTELEKMEKRLERLSKSDLIQIMSQDTKDMGGDELTRITKTTNYETLKGKINGQEFFYEKQQLAPGKSVFGKDIDTTPTITAYLNDRELPASEAEKIYTDYSDIAKERTERIEKMVKEKKEQKDSKSVKEDLSKVP